MSKHFEAILFDFDGVLLDSEPIHYECWREALAPLGVDIPWDLYERHCIGVSDRAMLDLVAGQARPPADPQRLWERYPLKQAIFERRMHSGNPFDGGLAEMLRSLGGFKLAVVTSSCRAEVEPLLVAGGIRDRFEAAVYGDEVICHKPAPDPYLEAARRLGVRTALVVEDSAAGLESGRAAGFEVLHIPRARDLKALLWARLGRDGSEG